MSIRLIDRRHDPPRARLLVARDQRRDDRDQRRRQGAGRDELEDQVGQAERGEERVEVARSADVLTMTTKRTQPSTREIRNAPETTSPARARRAASAVTGSRSRAGPRMGLPIGGLEAAGRDVRVDLGRRQALVAEQLLDDAQVGAAVEQVRRERVPERVRRDAVREPGPARRAGRGGSAARERRAGRRGGSGRSRPAAASGVPAAALDRTGRPSSR